MFIAVNMHRVYWVLFTVLCACVVSVPSSQRFNTRRGHISRALSKLRSSRKHSIIGASRGNHPSAQVTSEKNFPDDQFAEIYEEGSEAFMNPHHLQGKIEALTDTDEHFVDYSDEENYDSDGAQDSERYETEEVYYDDHFGSDPGHIRVVGQSTESEQKLGEGNDMHEKEDDDVHLDQKEAKVLDQITQSEQSLHEDIDEKKEESNEFDLDSDELHVVGQSTQSEQSMGNDDDEYDESDDFFESDSDNFGIFDHLAESEQLLDDEDGEYDGEHDDFESDANEVHITGQSTEFEQTLDGDEDEYGAQEDDLESEPNYIHVAGRSTASEQSLPDDEDEYDGEEDVFDSNLENVQVFGQSGESGELFEDNNGEEDESGSFSADIRLHGQSAETEQVNENETERNLHEAESFVDEDVFDHEMISDDLEFDNEEADDTQDLMVQGQALLLGESESEQAELSRTSNPKEGEEGWAEDELYDPLYKVKVVHYEDEDADSDPFEGDVPVDGMSNDDEPRAQKNFIADEESEIHDFDDDYEDDLDEAEIEDMEDIDPVEHEDELSEDQQDSRQHALEYDYDEDIESFENELSSLVRQDRVNGQSAMQGRHSSTYSFSSVGRELDSNRDGYKIVDEDEDHEDVDYEDEHEVSVSRTFSSTDIESQSGYSDNNVDRDVYLDDGDDDDDDEDLIYRRSMSSEASESDPSDGIHAAERLMDDAENEEVHVDGYAFVQNADVDYDMVASDESLSDHDDNFSHGSRFDSSGDILPLGETSDEEVFSHDQDEYDLEENRWSSRQDSDHYDEEVMNESDEDDDLQKPTNDDWNEYLSGLASTHQEQEMTHVDTSLSKAHEITNTPKNHWEDAERATHDDIERYVIGEELDINSHSHGLLQGSVKSIAV
ncbi:hypothetical protein FGB62_126g02 [Gracilaria domingensis]|nr:hypothetical protein FGB62_126g02 [Gracilaria domingensis]